MLEIEDRKRLDPFVPVRPLQIVSELELAERRKAYDKAMESVKVTRSRYVAKPTQHEQKERDLRHVGYETRRLRTRYA